MSFGRSCALALALCANGLLLMPATARGPDADGPIARRFLQLSRSTTWTPVGAIKLPFRTYHPQGMVKIGDDFYVSSVEIRALPKKLAEPAGGFDRDAGAGVGHLLKIGRDGALLADLILGEGAAYHPGGIDFDGASIWVPVSEYRPNSRAIVYRVDPATIKATEAFRFADHIGAAAYDRQTQTLIGVSWGSRRFYAWRIDAGGRVIGPPKPASSLNPDQYIDYQDCHGVGAHRMLCSGLGEYQAAPEGAVFQLGGVDLVDMKSRRPLWQVPIGLRSPSGRVMTQNPFFMETTATGLRAYFMPDDDESTIFIFDAATPYSRRSTVSVTRPPILPARKSALRAEGS